MKMNRLTGSLLGVIAAIAIVGVVIGCFGLKQPKVDTKGLMADVDTKIAAEVKDIPAKEDILDRIDVEMKVEETIKEALVKQAEKLIGKKYFTVAKALLEPFKDDPEIAALIEDAENQRTAYVSGRRRGKKKVVKKPPESEIAKGTIELAANEEVKPKSEATGAGTEIKVGGLKDLEKGGIYFDSE